jgi:hypothetical protein
MAPPTPTETTPSVSTVATAPAAVPVTIALQFLSTAHHAINAARASRVIAIAVSTLTTPPSMNLNMLKDIIFHVRVAHYIWASSIAVVPTIWTLFPDSWLCFISKGTPLTEWDLE